MSKSREITVKLLQQIESDVPQLFRAAQESSQKHWECSLSLSAKASRAFDAFQQLRLVPQSVIAKFVNSFRDIPPIDENHLMDMKLQSDEDKKNMNTWALENIITYACETLLDEEGLLDKQLIARLGWENNPVCYLHSQIHNIMVSFVCIALILDIFIMLQQVNNRSVNTEEIAKLGYISKMTSQFMTEFTVKHPIFKDSNISKTTSQFITQFTIKHQLFIDSKLEKEAENFIEELSDPLDFLKLHKKIQERPITKNFAFWLQAMTQSASHPSVFLALWDAFRINPAREVPKFNAYQRRQFEFCRRHFAALRKQKSTTKNLMETMSVNSPLQLVTNKAKTSEIELEPLLKVAHEPVIADKKAENKSVILKVVESSVEDKKEENKCVILDELDDFEIVCPYVPAIGYEVSAFSLFQAKILNVIDAIPIRWVSQPTTNLSIS